jgi:hypothetical protein
VRTGGQLDRGPTPPRETLNLVRQGRNGTRSSCRASAKRRLPALRSRRRCRATKSSRPSPAIRRRGSGQGGRRLRGRRDSEAIRRMRVAARPASRMPSNATVARDGRPRACQSPSSNSPCSRSTRRRRVYPSTFRVCHLDLRFTNFWRVPGFSGRRQVQFGRCALGASQCVFGSCERVRARWRRRRAHIL